jgi:tetratricopeptide (TPR) repeat protein
MELHQAGDFPKAAQEYQACVAAYPNRAEVRSNFGAVLVRLGNYVEAIEQYQAALKVASPAIAPQLRLNLALAYYKSARIDQAISELEPLQTAAPNDLNLALLLADCRLRSGRFVEAIDVLKPFEAAHQDNDALNYVLGMALIRAGRIAEGQTRVERILGRGESAEGHLLLGVAQFMAGDLPAASKEFSRSEALNPNLPSLHSYYGRALLFSGDADGAEAAFRKELAVDPNDFDANFQLASILAHRGKAEEARPLLVRAVQVRPDSPEARDAVAHGFRFDRKPGDPEGGIGVGSPAAPISGVEVSHPAKPLVLIFGSYTCPKLRNSAPELKRIAAKYTRQVDFRLVYIREAHPSSGAASEWQSTINERDGIALPDARNASERQEHAQLCVRKLHLDWPAVMDGMDNAAEAAYQAWPSRVYVVGRDGSVAFSSRLGELDFQPAALERTLRDLLSRGTSDARPH